MSTLWSLANPKLDEREVLTAMLDRRPDAATGRPGLLFIADKGFASKEFEADLALRGAPLLRPSFKREKRHEGARGSSVGFRPVSEHPHSTVCGA
ncbi:hypothetical protein ACFU6R_36035 [Streptomyces sp. NPDC057499]|uniref:hypothetical protein n=1 Tax=Streptomyces sp. NPDC057499 TaxID=3346150 RepID=UPI00367A0D9E